MSVPAHAGGSTPPQRRNPLTVPHQWGKRDQAALLTIAADSGVSDRAYRVYTVVVALDAREVTAATIAATLPAFTEPQAARLLGDLTTAGLLTKRRKTVGYNGDARVRVAAYSLADEGLIT